MLTKRISLNHNLDFSQISQRGAGRSSQRHGNEFGSLVVLAISKEGRGEAFILAPKELAIGN
jgi:hypothetical protein